MPRFRIIPVVDILNSKAVHAIRGERTKYKPMKSKLIQTTDPIKIIKVLKQKYNFREFYIADLDAIIVDKPNLELLTNILKIPEIKVILDPGIKDKKDILKFSDYKLDKLIIGLETINNLEIIHEGLNILSKSKLIVSVDMYRGNLISKIKEIKAQQPIDFIKILKEMSIQEIILLDLFRVGQKIGGIPQMFLKIREIFNGSILAGGGIKNIKDLMNYNENQFSGVLISTALHDGSINLEKLENFL